MRGAALVVAVGIVLGQTFFTITFTIPIGDDLWLPFPQFQTMDLEGDSLSQCLYDIRAFMSDLPGCTIPLCSLHTSPC